MSQVPVSWLASSLPKLPIEFKDVKHLTCFAGQGWQWDSVQFEILSPHTASYQDESIKDNNRSCVLRITSVYGSILLAGDMERSVEMALAESSAEALKSDVLIAPHHGSRTSSSEALLDAVSPQMAIFTVGYRNRFGHPKADIVDRYSRRGIQTYRSDVDGAVLLRFNEKEGLIAKSWRKAQRRYWHDK